MRNSSRFAPLSGAAVALALVLWTQGTVAGSQGKAEVADLRTDRAAAADLYEKVSTRKSIAPEDALVRLGRASLAAGDRKRAAEAFQRVYYEFPLSEAASTARDALASLQDFLIP